MIEAADKQDVARQLLDELSAGEIRLEVTNESVQMHRPRGDERGCRELLSRLEACETELMELLLERSKPEERVFTVAIRDGLSPCSHSQESIFSACQEPNVSRSYNITAGLEMCGKLDRHAFETAVQRTVMRHAALRSQFYFIGGSLYQRTGPDHRSSMSMRQVHRADLQKVLSEEKNIEFALQDTPLVRFSMLELVAEPIPTHVFLATFHHLVADGSSLSIFLDDLISYYRGDRVLRAVPLQYTDYCRWQRNIHIERRASDDLAYWQRQLEGAPSLLTFPPDMGSSALSGYAGGHYSAQIGDDLESRIRDVAKSCGTTPFKLLLACYFILLAKYTGQRDVIVGTPVANRPTKGLRNVVGLFMNPIPVRLALEPDAPVTSLIEQLNRTMASHLRHQDFPLTRYLQYAPIERFAGTAPVFQTLFSVHHDLLRAQEMDGLDLTMHLPYGDAAKFDVMMELFSLGKDPSIKVEYRAQLYSPAYIEKLVAAYLSVVRRVCENPSRAVTDLSIVSERDTASLLALTGPCVDVEADVRVEVLIGEQMARTPDAVAVVSGDRSVSYRELDERANQIANQLIDGGMQPGERVAICLRPGPDLIASLIATMKIGCTYTPIDPEYPPTRMAAILDTLNRGGGSVALVHEKSTVNSFIEGYPLRVTLGADSIYSRSAPAPLISRAASPYLYCLFTSGTTGTPKGVNVRHRAFVNLLRWYGKSVAVSGDSRVLVIHSFSFDATQKVALLPLLHGGTLFLNERGVFDPDDISRLIGRHRITLLNTTPSAFSHIARKPEVVARLASVKYLTLAGEAVTAGLLKRARELGFQATIINQYGPTECTDIVSSHTLSEEDIEGGGPIPIGRPNDNNRIYLLDDQQQMVPVGVPGELYLGGIGVSDGYLAEPELTAAAFIERTWPWGVCERLYKSGDFGRVNSDGNIEFLGRLDQQIKLRGVRIELGEVIHQLMTIDGVDDCTVTTAGDGGTTRLIAYVVPRRGHHWDERALQEAAARLLPEYMVPKQYVRLEALPVNANGKVDFDALPQVDAVELNDYVAPSSALEVQLCSIWGEVLGLERVGLHDNFFQIGGSSINAMQVVAACHQRTGREMPLSVLFKHRTVGAICQHLKDSERPSISRTSAERYPLSFAQERLLFIECFAGSIHAYHMPYLVELDATLSREALERALAYVVGRHEVLNTVYLTDGEGLNCQVRRSLPWAMVTKRYAAGTALVAAFEEAVGLPFDLQHEPGFRAQWMEIDAKLYLLLMWHHIAFDGWSADIFLRELSLAYTAFCRNQDPALPALSIQYSDYSVWQRAQAQSARLEADLDYWKGELLGFESLVLPTDRPRRDGVDYRGDDVRFTLDSGLSIRLRELARSQGTTLHCVLLSGLFVTLSVWSGQGDIVVGMPSDNRDVEQTQSLIGFFVNSLVIRANVSLYESVGSLIAAVHERVGHAKDHQALPFERLVDALGVVRDSARHPVFQVMFTMQNFAVDPGYRAALPFTEVDLLSHGISYSPAKFDLNLTLSEGAAQIAGTMNFAVSLFDRVTLENLCALYCRVLAAFVANPRGRIGDIALVSDQERALLLDQWAAAAVDYPQGTTICQQFEEQVSRRPEAVALVMGLARMSYRELSECSERVAALILSSYRRAYGTEMPPGTLVGLYMDRGMDMIVGMLAILKAGAAYVPIAPEYPEARTAFILVDTQSPIVLTQTAHVERLAACCQPGGVQAERRPLLLPVDVAHQPTGALDDYRLPVGSPHALAYVIYTSGTTGQPKGVMVGNQGVVSLVKGQRYIDLSPNDTLLQLSSPVFDAATFEIWGALLNGAKLVLPSGTHPTSATDVVSELALHGVSVLWLTRTLFDGLYGQQPAMFAPLRVLLIGGEPLTPAVMRALVTGKYSPHHVLNGFGPTECTTFTTTYDCRDGWGDGASVPIGKPISGREVYVLSETRQLLPVGAVGELYVGGAGLAQGYLRREALTSERFVEHPFCRIASPPGATSRLYRTGDRVRWLPDGNLAYVGRNDQQVKIRGFRIELGEIETVLVSLPGIRQAAVVDWQRGGDTYLAAYLVFNDGAQSVTNTVFEALAAGLAARLPHFMLPSSFTAVDAIPTTPNGKLDRRALPVPQLRDSDEYVAPITPTEQILCRIAQELLKVDQVGITDNFFRLGGHSLSALQMVVLIRRELGREVRVSELFGAADLRTFARQVEEAPRIAVAGAVAQIIPRRGQLKAIPLAPLQRRLFVVHNLEDAPVLNSPVVVKILGPLDLDVLRGALCVLMSRHEILRSRFYANEVGAFMDVGPLDPDGVIFCEEAREDNAVRERFRDELRHKFDLANEAPLRVRIVKISDVATYVILNEHHIVSDGWSRALIASEITAAYQSLLRGTPLPLAPLDLQYADYSTWAGSLVGSARWNEDLNYWDRELAGIPNIVEVPPDYPRRVSSQKLGSQISCQLESHTASRVHAIAAQQQTTPYVVMLSAFAYLISQYAGTRDVVIGSPVASRGGAELERLVGFFVNSVAQRIRIPENAGFDALLAQTQAVVAKGFDHASVPFDEIVQRFNPARNAAHTPIFQIEFAYQNTDLPTLSIPGAELVPVDFGLLNVQFDLSLHVLPVGQLFGLAMKYDTALYAQQTMQRLLANYASLLAVCLDNTQVSLDELPYLKGDEYSPRAGVDVPAYDYRHVLERFDCIVSSMPENIALSFEGQQLSYRTLDRHIVLLTRRLLDAGVREQACVGLLLKRSCESIISMLAVLRAGAIIVALDEEYPLGRLRFMAEDAGVRVVIKGSRSTLAVEELSGSIRTVMVPDADFDDDMADARLPSTRVYPAASSLCYITYTSGTTGTPKGVPMHHGALSNLVSWFCSDICREPRTTGHFASINFDVCYQEIFTTLSVGGRLEIFNEQQRHSPESLLSAIMDAGVQTLFLPPFVFQKLCEASVARYCVGSEEGGRLPLRDVVTGGAQLQMSSEARKLFSLCDGLRLHNNYGPCETHGMMVHTITDGASAPTLPPIGRAIAGHTLYVLSEAMRPVPTGAVGELYIGGVQLSPGYWGRQDLTDEKFIANPFPSAAQAPRLYRSGDLVRETCGGELEWIGRSDHMVKLRGYRIELGEIENALRRHEKVANAVAVIRSHHDEPMLVAYVEYRAHAAQVGSAELRDYLGRLLPRYAIPNVFYPIDRVPLLPNKKIDMAALPVIDFSRPGGGGEFVAPLGELETVLASLWRENLGAEAIGRTDDYFALGGHSLKAVMLVTRIRQELKIDVALKTLFEHPVLFRFAAKIQEATVAPQPDDDREVFEL